MLPTKREVILAAVVLITLPVMVEVGLRIRGVQFEPQLYVPDSGRGWTLRTGAMGVVSTETPQWIRINSHGFRDSERSYDKAQNTLRIAVLGNSWTEALQVPLEKTYTFVLQQELTKRACFEGKRIEVLNFGVAGYSTGQELLLLQEEVWKYHPDIVLLAFYPARDIANNIRELNNASNPEQSPYFVYRDKQLVLDDAFRLQPAVQPRQISLQKFRFDVNDHVRLLQAIAALQRFSKVRLAMAAAKERTATEGVENLEYSIYSPPASAAMQEAWRITEGLLVAMREEVKAHHAEFRVIVLATRPQVLPDPSKRAELRRRLGVEDLNYADRRLSEFTTRETIPITLLAPALSVYAETQRVYLNGFNSKNLGSGHWNELGHRLAGETIAGGLCPGPEDGSLQKHEIAP